MTGPAEAAGPGVPEQLIAVFAAAAARRPVWIGDPVVPPPAGVTGGVLPPGAFLVVGTSGSTSTPRAVVRTARSWTLSFPAYSALTGIGPGDRVLLTGPLFSTMQLFAAVHALAVGAIVTDDPAAADTAVCVPAALPELLDRIGDDAAPTPLRSVVLAGAALSDSLAARAHAAGVEVVEYYGAAELSFVAARRWPAPLTAFPEVQLRLRDGELWARSPFHALGYQDAAGPAALHADRDGFVSVGDLASIGTDGGLRLLGRGDAAVTVGGRTLLVEDLETTLTGLAQVRDAAVTGLPHPRFGQQLLALVVPAEGFDLAAVRAAARTVLRGEALPRRWLPVPRIPRRPNGKLDRAAIRLLAESVDRQSR